MKKILGVIMVLGLVLSLSVPALAADLSLYLDNQKVQMEVKPELKGGRAFVPLREVSRFFEAEIDWQNPHILLNYGDTSLKLTVNSKTALKNDSQLNLEAAPYLKNGRTLVPLRFISEAFGCEVNYLNNKVYIATPALYLDGKKVVSVQSWFRMTMGGVLSESKTNTCINKLYQFLQNEANQETVEPDYFDEMLNLDIGNFYHMYYEISFMESEGVEGAAIQQYKIYTRMNDYPEDYEYRRGTNLGECLIYDINQDKWYKSPVDDWWEYLQNMYSIGDWVQIFNNVV